jgi:hypothetical protein
VIVDIEATTAVRHVNAESGFLKSAG